MTIHLSKGQDPVVSRRLNRANAASQSDNTFKAVAEEWFTMKEKEWSSTHHTKSKRAFVRDVYKSLGDLPIECITPALIAKTIQDINKRDVLETSGRSISPI